MEDCSQGALHLQPNGCAHPESFWVQAMSPVIKHLNQPALKDAEATTIINCLLGFFQLADKTCLLGPLDSVIKTIKNTITESPLALKPQYLRDAVELPTDYPVRALFAKAWVGPHIKSLKLTAASPGAFRFEKGMDEVEGFAADLFREWIRLVAELRNCLIATSEY